MNSTKDGWQKLWRVSVILVIITSLISIYQFIKPTVKTSSNFSQTSAIGAKATGNHSVEPGTVLYQTNWSDGFGKWDGDVSQWSITNGVGLQGRSDSYQSYLTLAIPNLPMSYAVIAHIAIPEAEAELKLNLHYGRAITIDAGGIYVPIIKQALSAPNTGYHFSIDLYRNGNIQVDMIDSSGNHEYYLPHLITDEQHLYRIEVRGGHIKFLLDNNLIVDETDMPPDGANCIKGSCIALYGHLTVQDFKVITL